MKRVRIIYRKWFDSSDGTERFLSIYPNGSMIEIALREDQYDKRAELCQTKPLNPLAPDPFIKHKERATKAEFEGAIRRAKAIMLK